MTSKDNYGMSNNKEITDTQQDFLKTCQELGWGKLEVIVQDGEPVFSRQLEKSHQHKKPKA